MELGQAIRQALRRAYHQGRNETDPSHENAVVEIETDKIFRAMNAESLAALAKAIPAPPTNSGFQSEMLDSRHPTISDVLAGHSKEPQNEQ